MTLFLTGVTPLVCKWIFFMKKALLNRLFTSGVYRGDTDCT